MANQPDLAPEVHEDVPSAVWPEVEPAVEPSANEPAQVEPTLPADAATPKPAMAAAVAASVEPFVPDICQSCALLSIEGGCGKLAVLRFLGNDRGLQYCGLKQPLNPPATPAQE